MGVYLMVIVERKGMYLSWKVAEEKIELSQSLFVLELKVKVVDIFEDWEIVRPVYHKHG